MTYDYVYKDPKSGMVIDLRTEGLSSQHISNSKIFKTIKTIMIICAAISLILIIFLAFLGYFEPISLILLLLSAGLAWLMDYLVKLGERNYYALRSEVVRKMKSGEIQKEKEKLEWERRERHMRCNVCGNVFCYTVEDIAQNENYISAAKRSAGLAVLNAFAGTRYDMYEQSKDADRAMDKVKDFSRCPKCNSTSIVELTKEEVMKLNNSNPVSITAGSSADELKKFKELLDSGIISQEEFEAKKKQLLGL